MHRLLLLAALGGALTTPAAAHDEHEARLSPQVRAELTQARRATAPFHDLAVADAAGYNTRVFDKNGIDCIAQPGEGAMGVHFLNAGLLTPYPDALAPTVLMYEPMPGGAMRLVGAEYIVFRSAWEGLFPGTTPNLFGQPFHLVREGNRYGLPDFYALHLWLWRPNRSGLFADWNPSVRCP
jgi:hypothetical protein